MSVLLCYLANYHVWQYTPFVYIFLKNKLNEPQLCNSFPNIVSYFYFEIWHVRSFIFYLLKSNYSSRLSCVLTSIHMGPTHKRILLTYTVIVTLHLSYRNYDLPCHKRSLYYNIGNISRKSTITLGALNYVQYRTCGWCRLRSFQK